MDYFLGVGAQKAGTTWLHDQLALHPEIEVPARKEVHYFDVVRPTRTGESFGNDYARAIRRAARTGHLERVDRLTEVLALAVAGDDAYLSVLNEKVTDRTRVRGEITPSYACLSLEGFEHARRLLDDPLVVFVMRDPLERYWSAVRMANATVEDMHRAFQSTLLQPSTWSRADYPTTLDLLDRVFTPERVLVLFYEHLFTEESLMRVAAFLGVEQRWEWDIGRVSNPGRTAALPAPSDEVLERLRPVYEHVHQRFGERVPSTWRL